MGPAELVQALHIAREYYFRDKSKVEIAKEMGLSRYKVARILEAALKAGVVRIEIDSPSLINAELSEQLRTRLKLRHCIVVHSEAAAKGGESLRHSIGAAAAGLLTEIVTEDDILGIAWGRTLASMAVSLTSLAPCQVVQMTGVTGYVGQTSIDILRRVSAVSGGASYPIYAPLIMPEAETVIALQRHPAINAAMSRFPDITKAAVAIGSWDTEGSQVYKSLQPGEAQRMRTTEIAAEVCTLLLDAEGRLLHSDLDGRTLAIKYEQLRAIPEVIGVAGGVSKAEAIHAVVRAGIATSLVTDEGAAQRLLELSA